MPAGRPFKFTPEEFQQAWEDYFKWCDANPWIKNDVIKGGEFAGQIVPIPIARPYSDWGFCAFHDLGDKYLSELAETLQKHDKDENSSNKEQALKLSHILTRARAKCKAQKFEGAVVGIFKEGIVSKDLGMVEKTHNEHVGKDGEKLDMNPVVTVITSAQPLSRSEKDVDV